MNYFCTDTLLEGNLTQSTSIPRLSTCFHRTILVYVPAVFLVVLLPVIFVQAQLISRSFDPLPVTTLFLVRLVLNAYLLLNATVVLIFNSFFIDGTLVVDVVYPCVLIFFFFLHIIIDWNRARCGQVSSGIQHISFVLLAICGVPEFVHHIRNSTIENSMLIFVLYITFWPIVVVHTVLYCWADKRSPKAENSKELDSSFINRLTIWWFTSVQITGARRSIQMEDLFDLNHGSRSEYLGALFEKYWMPAMKSYLDKKRDAEKLGDIKEPAEPSLLYALFRMFKYEFITASVLKVISDTLQFANPFLLNKLINYVSSPEAPFWLGISCALLMFVVSELRSMVLNAHLNIMMRMGMKIQSALTTAVYRKTLRLSSSARRAKTAGEIINLMGIDVDVFQQLSMRVHQFWSSPYQIILCLVYLVFTLGYSALTGVFVMIVFIPINIFASIFIKRWQMLQMKLKDERVKMINEVLNGIKVIKLYAWEEPMEAHIAAIRERELALVRKEGLLQGLLETFNVASPFLVAAASFGTFILSSDQHLLTPQIAFVSLTLFNMIRTPMLILSMFIKMAVQTAVSNRRLRAFLVSNEIDDNNVMRNECAEACPSSISFRNVDASWDLGGDQAPILKSINASVPRGSFFAVVGTVGSGKSSFISAMLGELTRLRGDIIISGQLAYVPQQPWIQNLSVRDNITFGRAFNRKWYEKVISACALAPDLAILPDGDATEIGEKGINLSGGQKARISLARAVYQQDDVYLLDDPLSAVDAHVLGPRGLLARKTRILVTHALLYTREADDILVFHEGKITERGRFDELVKGGGYFAKLMEEYFQSNCDAKKEEECDENDDEPAEMKKREEHLGIGNKSEVVEGKKLIKKEAMDQGGVKAAIYKQYFQAASIPLIIMFIALYAAYQGLTMCRGFWLAAWSNENDPSYNGTKMNQLERLGIYVGFGLLECVGFFSAASSLVIAGLNASRKMHAPVIHNLMRSPISFFDTTPIGRILNRCSKDVDTIDSQLVINTKSFMQCMFRIVATLAIIVISTPLFVVVIIPLAILYFAILRFYVPTSRQLKRLESVNRSPVYSHFGETIQGTASIRAHGKVSQCCHDLEAKVDTLMQCMYLSGVSKLWLSLRLEFIANCVVFFAALFAAVSKEWNWGVSAGLVGVSVTYALNITDFLNYAVRQMAVLESNVVSVERIIEYTKTPNEAEWVVESSGLSPSWPANGCVSIENYSTRYRPGHNLVLRGITAHIAPGEKIGIVGRTGAGKSSFALALFRMIEPADGMISIDGIVTTEIGLHELRKRLTIIPQEPVLFSGTLRFNLDPFAEHSDEELWRALKLAHLDSLTNTLSAGLDHVISEGGENISVGQRQLVCLARATLRNSKILVLDEATAAVDLHTDNLIQATIRNHFKHCTVFTIAHRLNTILDYDRIMVLDKGEMAEMDSPAVLMANSNSLFSQMLADAERERK